jgi:putative transferase (TIGR04331 family)
MSARYLITTADERSWKYDRPVLFLGRWCCRYDRRPAWSAMDAAMPAPFGIAPDAKLRDIVYVETAARRLLPELAHSLNEFHAVDHSTRYWQILLGHWLLRCVSVVFNRYRTLETALNEHAISGTTVFDSAGYSLATADSAQFVWACNDDVWNHVLYARILEFIGGVATERVEGPLDGLSGFRRSAASHASVSSLKQRVGDIAGALLPKLSRARDAVLISTYLPVKQRLMLELSLGQIPQRWSTTPLAVVPPEASARARFALDASQYSGVERFLRLQLNELIPTCYLEGYASLKKQAEALPWPASPKFIFTSNRFDTDEQFKAWTAERAEQGIPYITGQHGNNYGTHIWAGAPFWPECAASDRFVTWGWTDGDERNVPAFVFRSAGQTARRRARGRRLLLIEMPVSHRIDPHDSYAEFAVYQDEQFRFVEALPAQIRHELVVRLHAEHRNFPWDEQARWRDRSRATSVEPGRASIKRMVESSRLVVHSYDSTGILETLALDIPTMCFWHGGLDHLRPEAKPYYEQLRSAGILYDTPESAASAVEAHWDAVDEWWRDPRVQLARRNFCDRYARMVPHPVRTLRKILCEARGQEAVLRRSGAL